MTAEILTFPGAAFRRPVGRRPPSILRAWADQHLPLIDAAMDLLRCDNQELRRRCKDIAATEGHPVLEQLVTQLDRLAAHLAGIVTNLSMVAKRIRRTMATEGLSS